MSARQRRETALWALAALAVMALIFWFSGQDAAQSDGMSRGLAAWLLSLLGLPQGSARLAVLNHLARKAAHFSIYALLCLCLNGALRYCRLPRFPAALALAALYAALDEFHQSLVPGRGPQLTDVLLDTCGAAVGGLVFLLAVRERDKA